MTFVNQYKNSSAISKFIIAKEYGHKVSFLLIFLYFFVFYPDFFLVKCESYVNYFSNSTVYKLYIIFLFLYLFKSFFCIVFSSSSLPATLNSNMYPGFSFFFGSSIRSALPCPLSLSESLT